MLGRIPGNILFQYLFVPFSKFIVFITTYLKVLNIVYYGKIILKGKTLADFYTRIWYSLGFSDDFHIPLLIQPELYDGTRS
jgi:hypothetical protein